MRNAASENRPQKIQQLLRQLNMTWAWQQQASTKFLVSVVSYIGHTTVDKCKEYQWCICLNHLDKSALAHHSITMGPKPHFSLTMVLSKSAGFRDGIITEVLVIKLDASTASCDGSFQLNLA